MISACEKNQRWRQALSLLALLQQTAILPNIVSLSAAISACEKSLQCSRHWIFWHWQQAFPAWRCILLSRDQCLCEDSAMAAGIGSSNGDAADLRFAWRHFLLSRDQYL